MSSRSDARSRRGPTQRPRAAFCPAPAPPRRCPPLLPLRPGPSPGCGRQRPAEGRGQHPGGVRLRLRLPAPRARGSRPPRPMPGAAQARIQLTGPACLVQRSAGPLSCRARCDPSASEPLRRAIPRSRRAPGPPWPLACSGGRLVSRPRPLPVHVGFLS